MHEYPLTLEIIKTAERAAIEKNAKRVTAIDLVVGEASGCVAESIALYFDLIAEGSSCEGAELRIERVKPMLRCESCRELFARKPFSFACPGCGGEGRPTDMGREFYIRSVSVEEGEA